MKWASTILVNLDIEFVPLLYDTCIRYSISNKLFIVLIDKTVLPLNLHHKAIALDPHNN